MSAHRASAGELAPGTEDHGARTLRDLAEIPVTRLRGLSERKAAALGEWGVETIFDLLTTYPHRYIDRSRQADLAELAVGEEAVVLATVSRASARRTRNRRSIVELAVDDGTGSMKVVFFNQPWRAKQLAAGSEALFFGKLDQYRGSRQMTNPVVDVVVPGGHEPAADRGRTLRVIPVYPSSGKAGLNSWEVGEWAAQAMRRVPELADPLEARWRADLDLVGRGEAFRGIHLPATMADVAPARRRLAFDELFRLQLALMLRRRALEEDARAIRHAVTVREVTTALRRDGRQGALATGDQTLVQRFLAGLPFELTPGQRKAMAVIVADLAGPLPMHRLLQGDVGSGKTVVAIVALLAAVQGGHQGALMVPTAVLADQHFMAVRDSRGRAGGDRRRPLGRRTAGPGGTAHQPDPGVRAGPAARGFAGGPGGPGGRHPRAPHRRRPFPLPRRGRDRRAAPVRGGAAGGAAGQGPVVGGRRGAGELRRRPGFSSS